MNNIIEILTYVEAKRLEVVNKYLTCNKEDKEFWYGEYAAYNNVAQKIRSRIEDELNKMRNVSRETLKDVLTKTNPYME